MPDLLSVLLKFCCWPFVLMGDASKAFLKSGLYPEGCNTQRLLWLQDEVVWRMRFRQVTFGFNCSLFLQNSD